MPRVMFRLSSDNVARVLILLALLLGETLRLSHVDDVRFRSPDERLYTRNAQGLVGAPLAGAHRMVADYFSDPSNRFSPPPTRIGYLAVMAAVMAVSGRSDTVAGAWASCAVSIVGLGVIALIGWQFLGPWVAVVATFLLAFFPPDLVMTRRAWTDGWVAVLAYVLLYCALSLANRTSRWVLWVFVVTGALFVVTKETSAMVWGLCGLWIVLRRGKDSVGIVAAATASGIVSIAFLAWLVGGFSVLWNIIAALPAAGATGQYAIEYQTGPEYWLLKAFWITSPLTFTLALIGLVVVPAAHFWRDRSAAVGLALFTLFFLSLPAVLSGWLNLRYASPAFGPLCLLAAGTVCAGFEMLRARISTRSLMAVTALGCVAMALAGIRDYRYFTKSFVRIETQDLAPRMIFEIPQEEETPAP